MKKISLVVLMGSLLLLSACNKPQAKIDFNQQNPDKQGQSVDEENKNEPTNADQNSANSSASADHDQLVAKTNAYVDCLNKQSKSVMDAQNYYLNFVNAETGPTGKEPALMILYTSSSNDCVKAVQEVAKAQPSLPDLEKAGETYLAALVKIDPLLVKAHDYYDQKNYKDDAMALGKEMHKPLVDAWKEFEAADKELRTQVDKVNNGVDEKELADLEQKEGRKMPFLLKNTLHFAKPIVEMIDVDKLENIPLEELTAAITDYDKAVTELNDFITAHKDDINEATFLSFTMGSKDFLKSAKDLMRRIRDKEPYSTSDKAIMSTGNAWSVEGSPSKVVHIYNTMVDAYNLQIKLM